jgi:beta-xylosidase
MLWAPDAAEAKGTYYLYFPAKDKEGVFRIGVASSAKPEGPFTAEKEYMKGSFSIDPCVFKDKDGTYYLYFGGIWGGQLQRWKSGNYLVTDESQPANGQPALMAKVARLDANMKQMAEAPRNVQILDAAGKVLLSEDHDRRFFEAAFVHHYQGKYYFSYSTGDTHNIAYATGNSPYGPFTYQGVILKPVKGWTNHHSIVEQNGKWYLYYHDVEISGKTHLRNIKVTELKYRPDGSIEPIDAYK